MAYKHIIWDWNGTLFNDAWLCVEIMNGMLRARGLAVLTVSQYRDAFDFPVEKYYRRLGFDFEREPFEKLGTEFIVAYEKRRLECGLQPRAKKVLGAIEKKGYTQSVLSAYRQDSLEQIVGHFKLSPYFVRLTGLDDHYAAGKEESARQLLAELPHAPHEIVVIGDTVHDFDVARSIGVDCLLIACGHHSRTRLERCGVPVLTALDDLLLLVQRPPPLRSRPLSQP